MNKLDYTNLDPKRTFKPLGKQIVDKIIQYKNRNNIKKIGICFHRYLVSENSGIESATRVNQTFKKTESNLVSFIFFIKSLYSIKLILLITMISISNCKPIKYLVNKNFEPLSVTDQQIQSIADNVKNIDSLVPNIGVRISASMIKEFLPKEIDKLVKNTNDGNFKIHEFTTSLNLAKQAIIINSDFNISLNNIKIKISGTLQGYIAVSSIKDSIFLLPALKTLKVKKIMFTDKKPGLTNRAIAALIKPAAKHFLDNLNGKFITETPSIYTGWGKAINLDVNKLFSDNETIITGSKVDLSRYIKKTSLLVSKRGISIMFELEKNKQVKDTTVVGKENITSKELNKKFKQYHIKYAKLWLSNFGSYSDATRLSMSITKPTIAGIFNDVLSKTSLDVSHKINIPKISGNNKLEIDRLKLDCNSVREKFSYPGFSLSKKCNYSCMKRIKVKLGPFSFSTKRIEDPICAAARNVCKVGRETARIAWQTSRESARIAKQIYNEGKVAACKIATEASELVNLGRVKTSSEASGKAYLNIQNIIMDDNLSTMYLKIKGDVKLKLNSSLSLHPQDIGHLLMCSVNYDKEITTNITGDIINQFSQISFTPVKMEDNIILTGDVLPLGYKAKASVSPLHQLLADPLLAVKCTPLYSLLFTGGILGGTAALLGMIEDPKLQLLLKGNAIGTYQLKPFTQKITPIIFKINNGEDRKANVEWGVNSIDYSY